MALRPRPKGLQHAVAAAVYVVKYRVERYSAVSYAVVAEHVRPAVVIAVLAAVLTVAVFRLEQYILVLAAPLLDRL